MIIFTVLFNFIPVGLLSALILPRLGGGLYGKYFFLWFVFLFFFLLPVISYYKIWRKMWKPAWRYFLPFFADSEMLNALGGNWGVLFYGSLFLWVWFLEKNIPYESGFRVVWGLWVLALLVCLMFKLVKIRGALARGFGKGIGFSVGLFFLPFIFVPMLAFGKAKWKGEKEESGDTGEENDEKKVIGEVAKEQARVEKRGKSEQIESIASTQVLDNTEKDKNSHLDTMKTTQRISWERERKISFHKKKESLFGAMMLIVLWVAWAGWYAWQEYPIYLANKGATSVDCFKYEKVNREGSEGVQIVSYDVKKCGTDPVIPRYIERKQVLAIGSGAFEEQRLSSVKFPEGLVEIGTGAFSGNFLMLVDLPSSIEVLWRASFYNNHISELTLSENLKILWRSAFNENRLTKVELPEGLQEVGMYAFRKNNLTSVSFPDSLQKIGDYAFWKNNLTSVSFPEGIKEIGIKAFQNNQLTSVIIPWSVEELGLGAFDRNQLRSLEIKEGVKRIGAWAFNENWLTRIVLPESIQAIEFGAFRKNKIAHVKFPHERLCMDRSVFLANELSSNELEQIEKKFRYCSPWGMSALAEEHLDTSRSVGG